MDSFQSHAMQTRKQLTGYTFDPSAHLESFVTSVPIDSVEPERKLLALFEKLTKEFTEVSLLVEDDVSVLQNSARQTERVLLNELVYNSEKLVEVSNALDGVKMSFDLASEGAIRIGGKLSSAERERSHIEKSMELLGLIKLFQETPSDRYDVGVANGSTTAQLREVLPAGLQKKNWGTISEVLHDLRRILFELSGDDIKNAQHNINRVADRVEVELLGEFESTIIAIISDKNDDERLVEKARELAEWLHLFNNGQSIQKRYIFTVVQHRIPNDSFFQNSSSFYADPNDGASMHRSSHRKNQPQQPNQPPSAISWFFGGGKAFVPAEATSSRPHYEDEFSDEESDGATPGQSSHYPLTKTMSYGSQGGAGMTLMDHLSGLFGMINTVCQEQFSIIRQVFPPHTIAKVTRTLIQRIFNDPAFGIQARVDSILCPTPPQPPLSLPDYLDALVIVREKLSALFLLLMECCSHPSMRGMGSESACLKKAKQPGHARRGVSIGGAGGGGEDGDGNGYYIDADEEAEEILHSEAEIREFFDDQIGQVFSTYLTDYFSKETKHVRIQLAELLTNAVEDPAALSKPSTSGNIQLPLLRADRIKTILSIVQTTGTKVFLNRIFAIATDAVCRMESIGRDDKKLTHRVKDLFLLQLGFLSEGLFIPWSKACISVLLKQLAYRSSANGLAPPEILSVLGVITYGVSRIKSHFEEVYLRPLAVVPNIVAVCKENRMKVFKELDLLARQIIYGWTMCAVGQVEKILTGSQSRYDYAPKFETGLAVRLDPTVACDSACKMLQTAMAAMHTYDAKLLGLDLVKLFWRPLGQQVIGALISHIRKLKISPEGTKYLLRDLKEYGKNLMFTEAPDIIDMMSCLKELCSIFSCPSNQVVKMVVEDLRYLDTSVVLAFVKARSDAISRDPNHFSTHLSVLFPAYKQDTPLHWEGLKPMSQNSLAEAAALGTKWTATRGPTSLRRTAGTGMNPVSALYMAEVARSSTLTPSQLTANGRTVTVDLERIDELEDMESIPVRALSVRGTPNNRMSSNQGGNFSQFLPNRPDENPDLTHTQSAQAGAQLATGTKAAGGIARPDHLIHGHGTASAPGGGKVRPHSSVIKSSAATLLQHNQQQNQSGGLVNGKSGSRSSVPVPRKSVPDVPASSAASVNPAASPPAPQQRKLLTKMASFFQR